MKAEGSVRKLVEKGGANSTGLRPAPRNRGWKAPEWAAESGSAGGDTGDIAARCLSPSCGDPLSLGLPEAASCLKLGLGCAAEVISGGELSPAGSSVL